MTQQRWLLKRTKEHSNPVTNRTGIASRLRDLPVSFLPTTCYTESVIGVELDICRERGQVCEIDKDVNPYLLFENMTGANQYRRTLDTADEHRSPHMVYGIWRVGELVI